MVILIYAHFAKVHQSHPQMSPLDFAVGIKQTQKGFNKIAKILNKRIWIG